MSWLETIIIAIVEGLTEFLPVSSTAHMIITENILEIRDNPEFVKAFTVIIQFGAILSVVVLYFKRFIQSFDFYWKLLIGVIPALILGFLFDDLIDSFMNNMQVIAIMLILGGIVMIFVDDIFKRPSRNQEITPRRALIIGFCQCIAMIPGVSRSMATIVGGMSQRLSRKNAAEFSFFLAVPTMAAASGYKLLKLFLDPSTKQVLIDNISILLVGNIVAFAVAMVAIKFFIDFIAKFGFKAFGVYRIVIGAFILTMIYAGAKIQM